MPKKVLYGRDAIARVERELGRPLTHAERRVTTEEGFVDEIYMDTADPPVATYGVGQTGEWIEKGFAKTFKHHVDRAKNKVPKFEQLPEYLQAELVQSEYRGDLGQSPTAMGLFREGKYDAAATEFLNNEEYRTTKYSGIKRRMEKTSEAMRYYGVEQERAS